MIQGISDRGTFARLRSQGEPVRARNLRARHLADTRTDAPVRVAYAIPRRVGSAVERNRLRRRIRGVLDASAQVGKPLPPGATLFVVDKGCTELDSAALRDQVVEVIEALTAREDRL